MAKPRKPRREYARNSMPRDHAKKKERRELAKKVPGAATAPADAERIPQPHGGALLRGGVPGNKGGVMAALRRDVRKRLLRTLRSGGGVKLLGEIIEGKALTTKVLGDGTKVEYLSREVQMQALRTVLEYSVGGISQHAIVDENDEVLESGVVQLPMLDAPPTPPTDGDGTAAAPSLTQAARAKALDAAEALIRAAR